MMVMTAKVNLKKILLVLAGVAGAILVLLWLLGGDDSAQTAAPSVSSNDGRVQFLSDFGWEVTTSPLEASQVKIPSESSPMFDRYNALQKSQGYDLTQYAGKKVMRYVYQVNNFPDATDKVYATVLVYKNEIIGGDITNTSGRGKMQGFKIRPGTATESSTESTAATSPVTQ